MIQEQPIDNIYYIEFVVVNLNKPARKNYHKMHYSKDLLIKLIMHSEQDVIAESAEMVRTQAIQNTIKCVDASLSLSVNGDEEEKNWKLVIFGRQSSPLDNKNQRIDFSQSQSSGRKQLKKIGHCEINPFIYVEVFNESSKIKFQENIQISHNISIDYEVYIHRSRQFLDEYLRSDQVKQSEEMIDTAFKKKPGGSKKIRYVELNENRQTSMNSSDFSLAKKPKIASLVRSGMKYVPHKRQLFNNNLAERKGREYHLQRKIKPLTSKENESRKFSRKESKETSKMASESGKQKSILTENSNINRKKIYFSYQGVILMVLMMLVAGYMMFPSRKV